MFDDRDGVWILARVAVRPVVRMAILFITLGVLLVAFGLWSARSGKVPFIAFLTVIIGGSSVLFGLLVLVLTPLRYRRSARIDWRQRQIRAPEMVSRMPVTVPFSDVTALVFSVMAVQQGHGESRTESAVFDLHARDVHNMLYTLASGVDYPLMFVGWRVARRLGVPLVDASGPSGVVSMFWPHAETRSCELIAFGYRPSSARPPMATVDVWCRVDRRNAIRLAVGAIVCASVTLLLPIDVESWRLYGRFFLAGLIAFTIPFFLWDARLHGRTHIVIGPDSIEVRHAISPWKRKPFPTAEVIAVRIVKLPYKTKEPRVFVDLLGQGRLLQRIELPEAEAIEFGVQVAAILGLLGDPEGASDPNDPDFLRRRAHAT